MMSQAETIEDTKAPHCKLRLASTGHSRCSAWLRQERSMSRILRGTTVRRVAFSLVLAAGLPLGANGIASAGDFDAPGYTPYNNRAPEYYRMGERERYYNT